jgi:hypothetical protein
VLVQALFQALLYHEQVKLRSSSMRRVHRRRLTT